MELSRADVLSWGYQQYRQEVQSDVADLKVGNHNEMLEVAEQKIKEARNRDDQIQAMLVEGRENRKVKLAEMGAIIDTYA